MLNRLDNKSFRNNYENLNESDPIVLVYVCFLLILSK